jgi:hypothetical protein
MSIKGTPFRGGREPPSLHSPLNPGSLGLGKMVVLPFSALDRSNEQTASR